MSYWIWLAAALAAAYLLVRSRLEAESLTIARVDVPMTELPAELDGYTLLHLSDLHLRAYGPQEQELIRAVRALPGQALVITGDFLGGPGGATVLIPLLMELGRDRQVYAVLGNHDHKPPVNTQALVRDLTRAGVRVLMNRGAVIHHRGRRLRLAGVDDPHSGRDDLARALADVPPTPGAREPLLLLAHSPDILEAASRAGVDLVLAGHTHGGQICLPGGVPLWTNTRRGRFGAGLFQRGTTRMFVTRGVGTAGLRMRLFCPPEIAVIRLVAAGPDQEEQTRR